MRGRAVFPFMLIARRSALLGLLTCVLGSTVATPTWAIPAEPALDLPAGPVVLTVGGALRNANRDGRAAFDMAMLEKLPQVSFSTQTPWYPSPRKFTGPLLRDVLAAAGAQGRTIEARALNDYRVSIPVDDTARYDVIVARLIDDKPMAVRDKGPLFLIYPFDRAPELRNSIFYGRSAWQLTHLELR
ncbi:molybdopterin-dependent oxidoreductase [Roseateles sp. L2-2]|uniref:molybdopterin-dependent oxidoreductase n=1 Tax=Roseateles TaxID=93681 RepID=UPI003D360FD2